MFFSPGPSIRANRNGKSAEALRGSSKTKEAGDATTPQVFLSWSSRSISHGAVLEPGARGGVGRI